MRNIKRLDLQLSILLLLHVRFFHILHLDNHFFIFFIISRRDSLFHEGDANIFDKNVFSIALLSDLILQKNGVVHCVSQLSLFTRSLFEVIKLFLHDLEILDRLYQAFNFCMLHDVHTLKYSQVFLVPFLLLFQNSLIFNHLGHLFFKLLAPGLRAFILAILFAA